MKAPMAADDESRQYVARRQTAKAAGAAPRRLLYNLPGSMGLTDDTDIAGEWHPARLHTMVQRVLEVYRTRKAKPAR